MISIIIPTYNRAKFLPRAIDSVRNQIFTNWELIISDDGSTDNTPGVLIDYLKDPRIHYLKNKNRGATAARNSGANVAKGDYITFLDSDDEAKPNWLLDINEELENGAEVVCCGYDHIDYKGELIRVIMPINMGPLYGNRTGRFNGGVFVLKTEYFINIGGYDEKVRSGQHTELAIRLFNLLDDKNIIINNIFKPLIKVHVHKEAKIRNDDKAIYEGMVYTLRKHETLFKKNNSLYINYLRVGAVSAFRIGKIKEAQKMFLEAWKVNPLSMKTLIQLIFSIVPFLGRRIWIKISN